VEDVLSGGETGDLKEKDNLPTNHTNNANRKVQVRIRETREVRWNNQNRKEQL
jgi:hypothetical protein